MSDLRPTEKKLKTILRSISIQSDMGRHISMTMTAIFVLSVVR